MITIDARGKQCPFPVVLTKKALKGAMAGEIVKTFVDNEIAVQNLTKMAKQLGLDVKWKKHLKANSFAVEITAGDGAEAGKDAEGGKEAEADSRAQGRFTADSGGRIGEEADPSGDLKEADSAVTADGSIRIPDSGKDMVVVISSDRMGVGNDELGAVLLKGFIYALSGLSVLPKTVLFYNGGAKLTAEGSESAEDLKNMEAQGVEILTCGTCLNYYGLTDQLTVGGITNMYTITEKMAQAGKIIKPC